MNNFNRKDILNLYIILFKYSLVTEHNVQSHFLTYNKMDHYFNNNWFCIRFVKRIRLGLNRYSCVDAIWCFLSRPFTTLLKGLFYSDFKFYLAKHVYEKPCCTKVRKKLLFVYFVSSLLLCGKLFKAKHEKFIG